MKKIIFGAVLAVSTLLMSCEKEVIQKTTKESTVAPSVEKIDAKRYTTIACETIDNEGHKGIGTRCRKALGDDCKKVTACAELALSTGFVLPDHMTQQEFEDLWQTEEGTRYLESLGYYQRDLE